MSNPRLQILVLGWVTLIGFPIVGLAVFHNISAPWYSIFKHGMEIYWQLLIGTGAGLISAFILKIFLERKSMRDMTNQYAGLLGQFNLNKNETVFLSFCAGVGEEILFRGVIQYYCGIWITAVLFVAIHGYLNPWNWKITQYGLLVTVIFIGVGFLYQHVGIYACILVHMIIDIILFGIMLKAPQE